MGRIVSKTPVASLPVCCTVSVIFLMSKALAGDEEHPITNVLINIKSDFLRKLELDVDGKQFLIFSNTYLRFRM